ncbi:MAG: hypothetical protein SGI77_16675 [Pirellulaceae bacterium]|nr:hypothetical protein [Pirellulaceae bacterium]
MTKDSKNVVIVNLLFWVVAALLHPLLQFLPTESSIQVSKEHLLCRVSC